jgi:spermidine synthase
MIAHVPLFTHPNPEKVLIIGGGDGGSLREVARHTTIVRIVMVEIDELVVRVSREFLPFTSTAFDDPRLELLFVDGCRFAKEATERFDVVIVDSTDPLGPGIVLFQEDFYRAVAGILRPGGILITQAENAFLDEKEQAFIFGNQRPYFKRLHPYLYTTLSYPGGLYTFGFASQDTCPLEDFDAQRVRAAGLPTRYYNPGVHRGAFRLPNFLAERLGGLIDQAGAPR